MKKIVPVVIVTLMLSGCATFSSWFGKNEAKLQLGVHIATNIAIRGNPDRATRITNIASKTKSLIATGTITNGSMVKDYVLKEVSSMNLTDADKVVLNDLLNQVQDAIKQAFTDMGIATPEDQMVEIGKVLDWVLEISTTVKPNV
jgi:hypothetical protein